MEQDKWLGDDTKDEYSFSYYSTIHEREIKMEFNLSEGVVYSQVANEFFNFLSAIYGYQIKPSMIDENQV